MAQDVDSWGAVQPSLKFALPLMAKRIHGKKLKDSAVVTLIHIIDNYNDTFKQGQLEGWSAPGVEYLMEMQSLSESVVNENISLLVKLGLLTQIGGGNNRTHSNAKFIPNFEIAEAWVEERRAVRAKFQEELNITIRNQSGNPDPIASGNHRNATGNPDDLTGNQDAANGNPDPTPSIIPSITPTIKGGEMEGKGERRAAQADAPGGAPTHALKKRAAKAAAPNGASPVALKKASRDLFEAFIAAYPDDAGRDDWAWKAYSKAISQGVSHEQIMARVADAAGYPGSWLKTLYSGSTTATPEAATKPVEAPPVVEDEPIWDAPDTDPWDGVCIVRNATCATEIGAVVNVVGERAPAVVTHRSGDFYGVLFRDGRRTTTLSDHISLARGEAA